MTICRFWKTGNCKFGSACRNEHPPGVGPHGQVSQPAQPQNRFALFERAPDPRSHGYSGQTGRQAPGPRPRDPRDSQITDSYGVKPSTLEEDLRERPLWLMSAYGPGQKPPVQLFGGPQLEQSPEEIRTLHYIALASGNPQQSAALEAEFAAKANQHVEMVKGDIQGALKYLRDGEKQHPNRKDICHDATTHRDTDGVFAWDVRQSVIRDAHRPPRRPGFGGGTAGQSHPSGFGQQGGQAMNAGFGSTMNGAPSIQPQQAFGQSPQQNGFSHQQQGGLGPSNGAFGQQPPNNPFGQQQPTAPPSSFGQPVMQGMNSGFGQSLPQNENVPFGGQPAQMQNGFGGGMMQQSSGFGQQPLNQQPNGFPAPQHNGTPQQQSQSLAPPSRSWQSANTNAGSSGFNGSGPNHVIKGEHGPEMANGALTLPLASGDISTYTTRAPDGRLSTWKGRPVQYDKDGRPLYAGDRGVMERIWFPDGPPTSTKVNTMGDIEYPTQVVSVYQVLMGGGAPLQNGSIPELPPRIDMTRWDV